MIGRVLSLVVALLYLTAAFLGGGAETAFKMLLFIILPLACIWFSDAMGSYTGVMRGQSISTTTPGCLVAFGGWLVLMLPVIIGIIGAVSK